MVLITVLLFSSLISLLVVMSQQTSELLLRISANHRAVLQNFQTGHAGLQAAYKALQNGHVSCRPSAACHGSFAEGNYDYYFEPLQTDVCAELNRHLGVKYWRITVRAQKKQKHASITILQETVALPFVPREICKTKPYLLKSGWQSWRRIK